MEPDSYSSYQNTAGALRKKIILLVILIVVALIGLVILQTHRTTTMRIGNRAYTFRSSQPLGSVELMASGIADSNGLTISLNGTPLAIGKFVSSGSLSKSLPSGSFDLKATKPGFKPFSVQFTVASPRATIVSVSLQPTIDTTIDSWDQVQAKGDPAQWETPTQFITNPNPIITITNVVYFYNKTWALITTYDGTQYGYEIARYDFQRNTWVGTAATTQFFSNTDVYNTPLQFQKYLENNNYSYIGQ